MKLVILMAALIALAGCNTVAGVGEDVSGGARTVQGWF
jgi:predicted small secreted protein